MFNSDATRIVTVSCHAGKVAVGGGAIITPSFSASIAIDGTYPSVFFGVARGWTASAYETAAVATNWSVTAWAVCAVVAP